jgi:ribosomal protein S18 acetylase RimI-like enzyme
VSATSLRLLRFEDGPALQALVAATGAFTEEELLAAAELIAIGHDEATRSGYRFAVAEEDGVVVGYTCYGRASFSDATWDLYWIAVAPGSQRRGVGSVLLAGAESAAAGEQGWMMLAETGSKSSYEPARRFYERNGYAEIARIPDFYGVGDDKVVYAKRLSPSPGTPADARAPGRR